MTRKYYYYKIILNFLWERENKDKRRQENGQN